MDAFNTENFVIGLIRTNEEKDKTSLYLKNYENFRLPGISLIQFKSVSGGLANAALLCSWEIEAYLYPLRHFGNESFLG